MRTPISHLQEAPPEVIAAMVDEADWDFDILKLEKASNHRWVALSTGLLQIKSWQQRFGGICMLTAIQIIIFFVAQKCPCRGTVPSIIAEYCGACTS